MIPGQLGPTSLVLPWVLRISVMRTMSMRLSRCLQQAIIRYSPCCGIPSVILYRPSLTLRTAFSFHTTDLPNYQRYLGLYSFFDTFCCNGWSIKLVSINLLEDQKPRLPYGTKIPDAVAPVSLTASRTLANTGFPKCVEPAFFGFVPPTTFVPARCQLESRGRSVNPTIAYHIR